MLHVGEEPQHAWGQPVALAVPAAEAAAGEEARPELARERRALLSGRTRRKKMLSRARKVLDVIVSFDHIARTPIGKLKPYSTF